KLRHDEEQPSYENTEKKSENIPRRRKPKNTQSQRIPDDANTNANTNFIISERILQQEATEPPRAPDAVSEKETLRVETNDKGKLRHDDEQPKKVKLKQTSESEDPLENNDGASSEEKKKPLKKLLKRPLKRPLRNNKRKPIYHEADTPTPGKQPEKEATLIAVVREESAARRFESTHGESRTKNPKKPSSYSEPLIKEPPKLEELEDISSGESAEEGYVNLRGNTFIANAFYRFSKNISNRVRNEISQNADDDGNISVKAVLETEKAVEKGYRKGKKIYHQSKRFGSYGKKLSHGAKKIRTSRKGAKVGNAALKKAAAAKARAVKAKVAAAKAAAAKAKTVGLIAKVKALLGAKVAASTGITVGTGGWGGLVLLIIAIVIIFIVVLVVIFIIILMLILSVGIGMVGDATTPSSSPEAITYATVYYTSLEADMRDEYLQAATELDGFHEFRFTVNGQTTNVEFAYDGIQTFPGFGGHFVMGEMVEPPALPEYDPPIFDELYLLQYFSELTHNPLEIIAYLTAVYESFEGEDISATLRDIFDSVFHLEIVEGVEVRTTIVELIVYELEVIGYYEWESEIGGGGYPIWGLVRQEPFEIEMEYNWYYREVIFTVNSTISAELESRLTDEAQAEYYEILVQGRGGFLNIVQNPFEIDWVGEWPGNVSSVYGYRIHPIDMERRMHWGLDIGMPQDTPILGNAGIVTVAAENWGGYGNAVVVELYNEEDFGVRVLYAHMETINVAVGDVLEMGHVVGTVGSTGASTGPHLHIEVELYLDGGWTRVNPLFFVGSHTAQYIEG
ncbi:MAG: M23 family metallopeptidase, partial [Clostridiales bacterium]|nr:M23 family metallopeptidase [Clostridiales bacterium]